MIRPAIHLRRCVCVLVQHPADGIIAGVAVVIDGKNPNARPAERRLLARSEAVTIQHSNWATSVDRRTVKIFGDPPPSPGSVCSKTPSARIRSSMAASPSRIRKVTSPPARLHACARARHRMTWPVPTWIPHSRRQSGGPAFPIWILQCSYARLYARTLHRTLNTG